MSRINKMLTRKRYKTWLQIFFVANLFLYLYSPFLDHWLGNAHYGRPHTHISLHTQALAATTDHNEPATTEHQNYDEDHEEGVLCLLDVDALSIILDFNVQPDCLVGFAPQPSLIFDFQAAALTANPVFLSSLDPPPQI